MIKISNYDIKNWNELSNLIDHHFSYFNSYTFRGQADSNWKLETTLTRAINKLSEESDKDSLVKSHLSSFRQNLRGRSKQNLNNVSENELYAIGQHFGLYTPLLDWTHSPYVALFFALQGKSDSGSRCLWAIASSLIEEVNSSQENVKNKIEIIEPLTNHNPRLVSQQGLFLKLPINKSLEDLVNESDTKVEGRLIYKINFDDSIKNDALTSLNNMNINNLTLFPDLMGSSHHTNYLLEIEPYLKEKRRKRWDDYNANVKKT